MMDGVVEFYIHCSRNDVVIGAMQAVNSGVM